MTGKHEFVGNGPVCFKAGCYQVASHEIHCVNAIALTQPYSVLDMMARVNPAIIQAAGEQVIKESPKCPHCNHKIANHGKFGCQFEGGACFCDYDMYGLKIERKEIHQDMPIPGVVDKSLPTNCPGHKCPECSVIWKHDYTCGGGEHTYGLCHACAQQLSANINRPKNIEVVSIMGNGILAGGEIVQIMNEHESFVVLNLCMKDGKELPADVWQANISAHRLDLRKKIEALRAREMATSKVMAKMQMEEMLKLSPEERAEFEKAARKLKEPKIKAPKPEKKDAQDKYKALLKSIASEIKTGKPQMSEKEVSTEAFIQSMIPDIMAQLRREKPGKTEEDYQRIARKRAEVLASDD